MNSSAAVYAAACLIFILLAIIFAKPLKHLFGIIVNSALGCGFIVLFNFAGAMLGLNIGVNVFTSLFVGVFGIPGFVSLVLLRLFV